MAAVAPIDLHGLSNDQLRALAQGLQEVQRQMRREAARDFGRRAGRAVTAPVRLAGRVAAGTARTAFGAGALVAGLAVAGVVGTARGVGAVGRGVGRGAAGVVGGAAHGLSAAYRGTVRHARASRDSVVSAGRDLRDAGVRAVRRVRAHADRSTARAAAAVGRARAALVRNVAAVGPALASAFRRSGHPPRGLGLSPPVMRLGDSPAADRSPGLVSRVRRSMARGFARVADAGSRPAGRGVQRLGLSHDAQRAQAAERSAPDGVTVRAHRGVSRSVRRVRAGGRRVTDGARRGYIRTLRGVQARVQRRVDRAVDKLEGRDRQRRAADSPRTPLRSPGPVSTGRSSRQGASALLDAAGGVLAGRKQPSALEQQYGHLAASPLVEGGGSTARRAGERPDGVARAARKAGEREPARGGVDR